MRRLSTAFNIGTQRAGTINNVAGDMIVTAGVGRLDLRSELDRLEAEVARLRLPPRQAAAMRVAIADAAASSSDPGAVARRLDRLTRTLVEVGALSSATVGVVEALRRVATALGPAGKTVLALLPI